MKSFICFFCTFISLNTLGTTLVKNLPFEEGGLLTIRNSSGDITVTSSSHSEISIKANKVQFGEHCDLTIDKKNERDVLIQVKKKKSTWLSPSCKVDLNITVPHKTTQNIQSGSGDLAIKGTEGDIFFKLGSGDIAIQAASEKISGATGSGDIHLTGDLKKVSLKSGSGTIKANLSSFNNHSVFFDAKTGSGDVTVKLPESAKVKASLQSGNGRIENQFAHSSEANFNVSIKTGNGHLKVLKK